MTTIFWSHPSGTRVAFLYPSAASAEEPTERYPAYPAMPCHGNPNSMQQPLVHEQQPAPPHPQQHLCKSNSLPLQYYDCDQYGNQQSMDYDDGYYQ
ncbi:hypothetical protein OESDEN_02653 [Oesophagostomum dentatum]|uniref:Uncharacterized protein n=1 Tax=Oesophagostomum dentatum TaxID=61180 RepID=A0A0B1TNF7_OESDE|nr:hypothetical protein OESDEN_02653 [Oesophagostomum dentatum]